MKTNGLGNGISEGDDRHGPNTQGANRWHAERQRKDDHHLRDCRVLAGNHLHTGDGEIGHVQDMLVDENTWSVRHIVVNTSNWWLGHQVLVAPQWITQVRWADAMVEIDLLREDIRHAPPYDPTVELQRASEDRLYAHYRRPRDGPAGTAPVRTAPDG